jgi:hypothetical protein
MTPKGDTITMQSCFHINLKKGNYLLKLFANKTKEKKGCCARIFTDKKKY